MVAWLQVSRLARELARVEAERDSARDQLKECVVGIAGVLDVGLVVLLGWLCGGVACRKRGEQHLVDMAATHTHACH